MKKIIVIFILLNIFTLGKEELSLVMLDLRYQTSKKINFIGILELKFFKEKTKIRKFENTSFKNLVKVENLLLEEDNEEFLNTFKTNFKYLGKIKKNEFKYNGFNFSDIENIEYFGENGKKEILFPYFGRGVNRYSKYNDGMILYDIVYRGKKFFLSDKYSENKEFKNFIVLVQEKIRDIDYDFHNKPFGDNSFRNYKKIEEVDIIRKKYIDNNHWNILEINFSENNNVILKKIKEIKDINYIILEDQEIGKFSEVNLSVEALKTIIDDDIKENEKIISKQNIVKNQISNNQNPKTVLFNEKKIINPIIYEIVYKNYMFKLVGDENLYQNQEIKRFIKYLKNLEMECAHNFV